MAAAESDGIRRIAAVRAAATYELVVEQIRKAIYLGRFLPGDKLPPERELADQIGVSRTTIREAVRVLEGEGLLSVRRGASGGLLVMGSRDMSPHQIEALLKNQADIIDSVLDYRLAVECAAAALAARRRTAEQLGRIGDALQAMERLASTPEARRQTENIARFMAADSNFHLGIAAATRNDFLVRAVEEARAAMFLPVGSVFQQLEDNANAHHATIFQAIKRRQPEAASEEMRRHIEETRSSLRDFLARAPAARRGDVARALGRRQHAFRR